MATKQYADINGLTEFYDGIVQKISDDLASYYTKTQVDSLISAITTLDIEVVQTLPTQDISQTTIYLVPKSTAQTSNTYDEYINTDGTSAGWELIGSTEIDLSGYVQKSQTAGLLKNDGTVDTVPKASQASVNAILDGTNIDSFGDVETALMGKMKSYALDKNIAVEMDLGGNESLVTQTTSNITSGSTAIPTSGAVYNYAFPRSEQAVLGAKNLADFVDGKSINPSGIVENYADRIATVNPIPINSGVGYKVTWTSEDTDVRCIYAVWNGSTLVRRELGITKDTVLNTSGGDKLYVCLYSGTQAVAVNTHKPMVILSTDTDSTYKPFAMTNEQLTNAVVTTFTGTTAEWNALTSAQKSAYTIVNLTDDFVYSRLSDIYSTDERVVGVWIDGKPLYQKTISCGVLKNNDLLSVIHNIANIDKVFIAGGFAFNSSGNSIPIVYYDVVYPQYSVRTSVNKTQIQIRTTENMSAYIESYVTIQYTKTTDA